MISQKDIIVASPDLMMADLEGEAVLLNIESGRYFGLNEVGTRIWAQLSEPRTVEEIVNALQGEYAVPVEQLQRDVMAFVDQMISRSLLHISDHVAA